MRRRTRIGAGAAAVLGLLLTTAVAATLSAGCGKGAPRDEWHKMAPPEGGFTVSFPGEPRRQEKQIAGPRGPIPMVEYVYGNPPAAMYFLSYSTVPALPATGAAADPGPVLDFVIQQTLTRAGGRASRPPSTAAVAGASATRDVEFDSPDGGFGFGRFCLAGDRLYVLRAVYSPAANRDGVRDRARRFLDSFQPAAVPGTGRTPAGPAGT